MQQQTTRGRKRAILTKRRTARSAEDLGFERGLALSHSTVRYAQAADGISDGCSVFLALNAHVRIPPRFVQLPVPVIVWARPRTVNET